MNYSLEGGEILLEISQKIKNFFVSHTNIIYAQKLLMSNFLLYLVVFIFALKLIIVGVQIPIPQNLFFADITKIDLVNMLNENRRNLGLNALMENETLNEAAELKAEDMIKNNYFAHKSPQGVTPWFWFKKAGYSYKYAGENLAVGFVDSETVYNAWFNSSSHKDNLLNKNYTEIGTAVVEGFEGNSIVVVQLFGNPVTKTVAAPVNNPPPTPPAPTPPKPNPTPVTPAQPVVSGQETQTPPVVENPEIIQAPPSNTEVTETPNKTQNTILPKVLSQSTEYFLGPENIGKNTLYLKFLNFVVYDNGKILQYFTFSLLILIMGCLIMNRLLLLRTQHAVMALRPMILIAILCFTMLLDKSALGYLIPYQVSI